MKVSVIIVNYNVKYFLEVCLHSVLRAAERVATEVIVVDNNSVDGSMAMVRNKFPTVLRIENKDNTGFSKANNQGVAIAKGEYILFLNPDTVMPEDFLEKMVAYMDAHPDAGSIGPRLIDGKGIFAPDGKKSFPTLSVAIFKTTGINKLFSKSPYFNSYYAVHIKEHQTAAVDVLSGCCMMVRSNVLPQIGGAFDEDYFMYCEDVDLSYRIQKAGYQNIYYPEVSLIHYKGESTKKATLSYVRVFNEALSTFVKKHYSKQNAALFILFINIGIALRAVTGIFKQVLKAMRMPLFDAVVLLGTLWFMKDFWAIQVKNIAPIPYSSLLYTFPVYLLLWGISMYLNGAYDQPYRALRVVRGMLIGTIIVLAYYGMLKPELRHSRAIILFSALTGTALMLALHELLHRIGVFKFTRYHTLPNKAVVVAPPDVYDETARILRRVHYAPELAGRINANGSDQQALGNVQELRQVIYTAGINEVIFCADGLSYMEVLRQMQLCGPRYDYKIHVPGSAGFVGSNSSSTAGDLYTSDRRYNLADFSQQRNKRMLDMVTAIGLLALSPLLMLFIKGRLIGNAVDVLIGRRTWVGYTATPQRGNLPKIRPGILAPYNMLDGYTPTPEVLESLNIAYAQKYRAGVDIGLMLNNYKYLGK